MRLRRLKTHADAEMDAIFIKKPPNPATIQRKTLQKQEYKQTFPIDTARQLRTINQPLVLPMAFFRP
jgi:hypothetical protein